MILGSHNSISYEKPKFFLARLFNRMAKCQNISLYNQYDMGVRCFDFRVRFNIFGKPYLCHGLTKYPGDIYKILDNFEYLNPNLYIRIAWENIFGDRNYEYYMRFCEGLKERYKGFKFQFCKKTPVWTKIENNFDKPFVEIQNSCHTLKELLKGPEHFKNDQLDSYNTYKDRDNIISMDFVEITK